jgi:hypothetical protein
MSSPTSAEVIKIFGAQQKGLYSGAVKTLISNLSCEERM